MLWSSLVMAIVVGRRSRPLTDHHTIHTHTIHDNDRISGLDCRGETVVDLYAGIGYYTLPLAVHARAARVVACEWNPDACLALRHNVAANGVGDRVEVLFGDNRVTTRALPDGMADRVRWSCV